MEDNKTNKTNQTINNHSEDGRRVEEEGSRKEEELVGEGPFVQVQEEGVLNNNEREDMEAQNNAPVYCQLTPG